MFSSVATAGGESSRPSRGPCGAWNRGASGYDWRCATGVPGRPSCRRQAAGLCIGGGQAVDFRWLVRGHKMLCHGRKPRLDSAGVSGIVSASRTVSVSHCFISIKCCCSAAEKAVDGGVVGAYPLPPDPTCCVWHDTSAGMARRSEPGRKRGSAESVPSFTREAALRNPRGVSNRRTARRTGALSLK
jgi:hypothetical protein